MYQRVIGCVDQHEGHIDLNQGKKKNEAIAFLLWTPLVQGSNSPPDLTLKERAGGHCSVCSTGG